MELEDPTEAYVPEFLKKDQEQIDYNKLKRQAMKHDAQMAKALFITIMIGFSALCFYALKIYPKETTGVVRGRDAKSLRVQDLQDTSSYKTFEYDNHMTLDRKRAFPHVNTGDTLHYAKTCKNPETFNSVRAVNNKTMKSFTRERNRIKKLNTKQKTK